MTENRNTEQNGKQPRPALSEWHRSLAELQTQRVIRRYRIGSALKRFGKKVYDDFHRIPWLGRAGDGLYILGFAAEYRLVSLCRILRRLSLMLLYASLMALKTLQTIVFPEVALILKELFGPIFFLGRGIYHAAQNARQVHRERGFFAAVWETICYLARGALRYAHVVPKAAAYIIPLCALALFAFTFRTMTSRHYTLAVQVDGETVGYVENEGVFDAARETVLERIIYADSEQQRWTIEPTYTLAFSTEVMNENQMADTILQTAGDEISKGTALYLDDELTAVCAEGTELRAYLNGLREPYEDTNDEDLKVRFNRSVRLVDGIYFNNNFKDYDDIVDYLSGSHQEMRYYTVQPGDSVSLIASKNGLTIAELCALNTNIDLNVKSKIFPGDQLVVTRQETVLEVRVTRTVQWDEKIPFSTEKVNSKEYAFGTTHVEQEGEEGIRQYTAVNLYNAAGELLEQTITGSQVIKEPVNERIVTGTKLPSGSVVPVGNGTFIWPVPAYRYCSRWYKSGHKGVDICAPAGTPIYASASGVVTKSGYERGGLGTGYGYSVLINHGNGYSTAYAHMLSNLQVKVGQAVSQGQLVGYMGSTGRSTGNHLHFEIRHNGSYLPPQNFFKK